MKALLAMIEWILFMSFIFALLFLFDGEPDLWDKFRSQAMGQSCTSQG